MLFPRLKASIHEQANTGTSQPLSQLPKLCLCRPLWPLHHLPQFIGFSCFPRHTHTCTHMCVHTHTHHVTPEKLQKCPASGFCTSFSLFLEFFFRYGPGSFNLFKSQRPSLWEPFLHPPWGTFSLLHVTLQWCFHASFLSSLPWIRRAGTHQSAVLLTGSAHGFSVPHPLLSALVSNLSECAGVWCEILTR